MWSLPQLGDDTRIEFSKRMTKSLGRCYPARGLVRLNDRLREAPTPLLREVLCHELAHLAVYLSFGTGTRPHGPEWQKLVRQAGYVPTRRAPRLIGTAPPKASSKRAALYEHRCPVCQSIRMARTSTRRWLCAECVADGLSGVLQVSKIRERGEA